MIALTGHFLRRIWLANKRYIAECECGWQSSFQSSQGMAIQVHGEHILETINSHIENDAGLSEPIR